MNCYQLNFIIFFWELVNFSEIVSGKTCALNTLFVCLDGETCKQVNNSTSVGICDCKKKYKRVSPSGACVKVEEFDHSSLSSGTGNSSEATGSAILGGIFTVFSLIALTVVLVLVAKKYRWLHRAREKAQQLVPRRQYPVLVSQEDDPPLA